MEDKTILCVDCQQSFVFSVGEQQFYVERGLAELPKRCKPCRHARRRRLGRRRRPLPEGAAPPAAEANAPSAAASVPERAGPSEPEPPPSAAADDRAANRSFWDDRPQWVRDAMAKALPPASAPGNGAVAARAESGGNGHGNGNAPDAGRRRRRRARRRGRRPSAPVVSNGVEGTPPADVPPDTSKS